MPEDVPPGLTPFVFSDPLGKRWPRLRTFLLITGVLFFFGAVLFVETLFIAPRMTAPFSLRQLKGQLKSLLTNLVGDTWQPEAVENVAHGPPERQEKFIANVLVVLREAKAAGVVVDWEQLDPTYKKDLTELLEKFASALHRDGRQLWLSVSPGQEIDYIDFEELSAHIDRFVALLFDETSDIDSPGPLASRMWFEGWLHVLLEDSDPKQWIIALGSYGYDWVIGGKKAELISFPEAMSRASNAEIDSAEVSAPGYNAYFYYEDNDKEHAVWFLDVVTFLNELREVRKQ